MPRKASGPQFPRSRAARSCASIPIAELREDALATAHRLIARGVKPGDRIALIAETGPEFAALVLRRALCRRLAGAAAAADHRSAARTTISTSSRVQLESADPKLLLYPAELADMAGDAAARQGVRRRSTGRASAPRGAEAALPAAEPDDICLSAIFERLDPLPARRRGHPPRAARQSRRPRPQHEHRRRRPRRLAGCPGTTTWAWSAACCRWSPTRCRSTISRPRISPAARSPGST